jgi:hypothetical protein
MGARKGAFRTCENGEVTSRKRTGIPGNLQKVLLGLETLESELKVRVNE